MQGTLIQQENIKLYKQVNLIERENLELQKKVIVNNPFQNSIIPGSSSIPKTDSGSQVYGQQDVNQTKQPQQMSCNAENGHHMNPPTNLQLSQPDKQNNGTSNKAMRLGYVLNTYYNKSN